jgi:hypothetical protein
MSAFFKFGFTIDLLKYESMLGKKFELPSIGICAFLTEDINSLNSKQFEELQEYHHICLEVKLLICLYLQKSR